MHSESLDVLFKKKIALMGGIFKEESLREDLFEIYDLPISYVKAALDPAFKNTKNEKIPYPYAVGYAENKSFNAFTCDESEGSIVGINSCVPILLLVSCIQFSILVDLKTGLPFHENNRLTIDTSFKLRTRFSKKPTPKNITTFFDMFTETDVFKQVISESKLDYALFLYDNAIRFLIMHEVMHIVMGHTATVKSLHGIENLSEFTQERELKMDKKFGQVIEFIADRHTCRGLMQQVLAGNSAHSYGTEMPTIIEVTRECFIYRSVILSISLLFHIFPIKYNSLRNSLIKTHPHPYIRMQWIITELTFELKDEKKFSDYIVQPFALSMGVFNSNFNLKKDWTRLSNNDKPINEIIFSHKSYDEIAKYSKEIQNKMWLHSPHYKNDGRL